MKHTLSVLVLAMLIAVSTGCSASQTPTAVTVPSNPTNTVVPTNTSTPTATATQTATQTMTQIPTVTPWPPMINSEVVRLVETQFVSTNCGFTKEEVDQKMYDLTFAYCLSVLNGQDGSCSVNTSAIWNTAITGANFCAVNMNDDSTFFILFDPSGNGSIITIPLKKIVAPTGPATPLPSIFERDAWLMSRPYFCAATDAEAVTLMNRSLAEMIQYFGWPLDATGLVTAYRSPWDGQVCFIVLRLENGKETAYIIPDGNGGFLLYPTK